MVVLPLSGFGSDSKTGPCASEDESVNWVGLVAAGSLIAGGFLLLTGRRRAGTVAAASGAALALLDQQETLRSWWRALPGHLDNVQRLLIQVQVTLDDLDTQREKLRRILTR
jgi:hypothetical protein